MFLSIFSGFGGLKRGLSKSRKWLGHRKKAKTAVLSFGNSFLFLVLFFVWVGETPSIRADEVPESAETLETPVAEFQELCRWKHDMATFAALQDLKVTGALEVPSVASIERCIQEKEKELAQKEKELHADAYLAEEIRQMSSGYPLEAMAESIARFDREVAALIVGIAKKESNWGKRVPLDKEGADCFNYWGFKGAGTRGVAMGHGCFGSPEEAVERIGNRLTELVSLRKTSDPRSMIIWKCGSSCATHTKESVAKWISDVNLYYRQLAQK